MAVPTAIALMHLTKTLHSPDGATALIALSGGDTIYNLGYLYALALYLLGAAMMLFTGCIANNISAKRRYPLF